MSDPATIAYYQENAPRYTMSFGQGPSRHLDAFLDRLVPAARVLELGCGGGRDAARIKERGFDLDATDGTPAMVRKAEERFGIKPRLLKFEDLDAEEEYDAIWAHACLLHASRSELVSVLAAIHRALKQDGWHYASYKLGDGEGRDLLGRWHNFPDRGWIEQAYLTAGFDLVEVEVFAGQGADGTMRDWIALTVQT